MSDMDEGLKTSYKSIMPQELASELATMRRNPADFTVAGMITCFLGCDREKGSRSAYLLNHNNKEDIGSWCPLHGWLRFDSVGLPPTEGLSEMEIADNQSALARKRGPRK